MREMGIRQKCHKWGDFTEYIPLVTGGHNFFTFFFYINASLKMTNIMKGTWAGQGN